MKNLSYNIVVLLLLMLPVVFMSCNNNNAPSQRVVSVTILPQQYFAEQIAGERFTVNCVVPANASPETYDPSPQQVVDIARSEAYMCVGELGFEKAWLRKLAYNNPEMKIFDTSRGVKLMEGEHTHSHSNGSIHSTSCVDPHIWCSPANAQIMAYNMYKAFVELDAEGEAYYRANYDALVQRIDSVQNVVTELLRNARGDAFAIYHPSLSYLARDYGLEQICLENMGKESSALEMKNVVNRAVDAQVKVVFIQREFNTKQAETFAQEIDAEMVTINPLNYDWVNEMLHIAYALAQH